TTWGAGTAISWVFDASGGTDVTTVYGDGSITDTLSAAGLFNFLGGHLKVANASPTVSLNGEDAYIEGTFEFDGALRFDNSSVTLGDSSFTTCTALETVANVLTCGTDADTDTTDFDVGADTGTDTTLVAGDLLDIVGGTNGIDTVVSDSGTTTTVTLNFDSTEVATTTWGAGTAISWVFDASGGTDVTTVYGDGSITDPLSAAGLFNVLGGNLKVGNAAPTVSLNGEDAYIEGTFEVDGALRFDNSSVTLGDSSFTTCTALETVANVLTCGTDADTDTTDFDVGADTGTDTTLVAGALLDIVGGTNGIDTVVSDSGTTTTVTLNFDSTEVATTTWGAGTAISWVFDASGGTDVTTVYGDGSITDTLSAAGLFNVLGGNLKVGNAAPTVSLNGEDAYIEGTFEVDGALRFDNSSVTLGDSSFTTCTALETVANVLTCGTDADTDTTDFDVGADTGTDTTLVAGDLLDIVGGTNGIDTVVSDSGTTTTVTLNFDSTEVATTTWGAGTAISWVFDASGGTDVTPVYD